MRTTLYEMHLFNNASQKHDVSFMLNGKESGKSKTEGERIGKEWEVECGRERVAVWVINVTIGQVFMRV